MRFIEPSALYYGQDKLSLKKNIYFTLGTYGFPIYRTAELLSPTGIKGEEEKKKEKRFCLYTGKNRYGLRLFPDTPNATVIIRFGLTTLPCPVSGEECTNCCRVMGSRHCLTSWDNARNLVREYDIPLGCV